MPSYNIHNKHILKRGSSCTLKISFINVKSENAHLIIPCKKTRLCVQRRENAEMQISKHRKIQKYKGEMENQK